MAVIEVYKSKEVIKDFEFFQYKFQTSQIYISFKTLFRHKCTCFKISISC